MTSSHSPTVFIVETTAAEPCPLDFLGDSADLVYFISFAHAERYGADHSLARAARVMKRRLRIDLSPLLRFADARTEDAAEARLLETIWQDPRPVARAALAAADAIDDNEDVRTLTSDFTELPLRLRELAAIALWAAQRGARIRLTYAL